MDDENFQYIGGESEERHLEFVIEQDDGNKYENLNGDEENHVDANSAESELGAINEQLICQNKNEKIGKDDSLKAVHDDKIDEKTCVELRQVLGRDLQDRNLGIDSETVIERMIEFRSSGRGQDKIVTEESGIVKHKAECPLDEKYTNRVHNVSLSICEILVEEKTTEKQVGDIRDDSHTLEEEEMKLETEPNSGGLNGDGMDEHTKFLCENYPMEAAQDEKIDEKTSVDLRKVQKRDVQDHKIGKDSKTEIGIERMVEIRNSGEGQKKETETSIKERSDKKFGDNHVHNELSIDTNIAASTYVDSDGACEVNKSEKLKATVHYNENFELSSSVGVVSENTETEAQKGLAYEYNNDEGSRFQDPDNEEILALENPFEHVDAGFMKDEKLVGIIWDLKEERDNGEENDAESEADNMEVKTNPAINDGIVKQNEIKTSCYVKKGNKRDFEHEQLVGSDQVDTSLCKTVRCVQKDEDKKTKPPFFRVKTFYSIALLSLLLALAMPLILSDQTLKSMSQYSKYFFNGIFSHAEYLTFVLHMPPRPTYLQHEDPIYSLGINNPPPNLIFSSQQQITEHILPTTNIRADSGLHFNTSSSEIPNDHHQMLRSTPNTTVNEQSFRINRVGSNNIQGYYENIRTYDVRRWLPPYPTDEESRTANTTESEQSFRINRNDSNSIQYHYENTTTADVSSWLSPYPTYVESSGNSSILLFDSHSTSNIFSEEYLWEEARCILTNETGVINISHGEMRPIADGAEITNQRERTANQDDNTHNRTYLSQPVGELHASDQLSRLFNLAETEQMTPNSQLQFYSNNQSEADESVASEFLYSEFARLNTYSDGWPHDSPGPEVMSNAGFIYTGIDDVARCITCGRCFDHWKADDDPAEHLNIYPNCRLILELVCAQSSEDIPEESGEDIHNLSIESRAGNIESINIEGETDVSPFRRIYEIYRQPNIAVRTVQEQYANRTEDRCRTSQTCMRSNFFHAGGTTLLPASEEMRLTDTVISVDRSSRPPDSSREVHRSNECIPNYDSNSNCRHAGFNCSFMNRGRQMCDDENASILGLNSPGVKRSTQSEVTRPNVSTVGPNSPAVIHSTGTQSEVIRHNASTIGPNSPGVLNSTGTQSEVTRQNASTIGPNSPGVIHSTGAQSEVIPQNASTIGPNSPGVIHSTGTQSEVIRQNASSIGPNSPGVIHSTGKQSEVIRQNVSTIGLNSPGIIHSTGTLSEVIRLNASTIGPNSPGVIHSTGTQSEIIRQNASTIGPNSPGVIHSTGTQSEVIRENVSTVGPNSPGVIHSTGTQSEVIRHNASTLGPNSPGVINSTGTQSEVTRQNASTIGPNSPGVIHSTGTQSEVIPQNASTIGPNSPGVIHSTGKQSEVIRQNASSKGPYSPGVIHSTGTQSEVIRQNASTIGPNSTGVIHSTGTQSEVTRHNASTKVPNSPGVIHSTGTQSEVVRRNASTIGPNSPRVIHSTGLQSEVIRPNASTIGPNSPGVIHLTGTQSEVIRQNASTKGPNSSGVIHLTGSQSEVTRQNASTIGLKSPEVIHLTGTQSEVTRQNASTIGQNSPGVIHSTGTQSEVTRQNASTIGPNSPGVIHSTGTQSEVIRQNASTKGPNSSGVIHSTVTQSEVIRQNASIIRPNFPRSIRSTGTQSEVIRENAVLATSCKIYSARKKSVDTDEHQNVLNVGGISKIRLTNDDNHFSRIKIVAIHIDPKQNKERDKHATIPKAFKLTGDFNTDGARARPVNESEQRFERPLNLFQNVHDDVTFRHTRIPRTSDIEEVLESNVGFRVLADGFARSDVARVLCSLMEGRVGIELTYEMIIRELRRRSYRAKTPAAHRLEEPT